MKQVIALKLHPTPEHAQMLRDTMRAFNAACDYAAGVGFEQGTANKLNLQKLCYVEIRARFGLSAQLTILAIRKAAQCLMRDKKVCPKFRADGSITYDRRCMSYKGMGRVSLLTMQGRVVVPMMFGAYQEQRVQRICGEADLVLRDGVPYLYQTVETPEPPIGPLKEFLGVDLGVTNLLTDSDGKTYCGKETNGLRRRHDALRQKLQKKGTKSAKRLMKQRRHKEHRWATHQNHVVSKQVVEKARDTGRGIAVEELTGIRTRTTVRKAQRLIHHSWSFAQLRAFLTYKAKLAGVLLVAVDPRNTSRECQQCGHTDKANRKSQSVFHCLGCGFSANADHNAARVIAGRAALSLPYAVPLTG